MPAKRIAVVVGCVAAVAWLAAHSLGFAGAPHDSADGAPPDVAPVTPDRTEAARDANGEVVVKEMTGASLETTPQPDSEAHEQPRDARGSFAYERPPSWFEVNIGRNYQDCKKKGLQIDVCKHWFEARDQEWASETEQRIEELLSTMPMLRLSKSEKVRLPNVECRTTWCRIVLDVDLPALIDHKRSIGQWDDNWQHKFVSATGHGWYTDRAEELRLGLVMSGLIEADAEVEMNLLVPAGDPDGGFLYSYVHRCPKRYEVCGPH